MLKYDSSKRITAQMCLQDEFFRGAARIESKPQIKLNRNNITMAPKLGGIGNMVIGGGASSSGPPAQVSTPEQAYKDDFIKPAFQLSQPVMDN